MKHILLRASVMLQASVDGYGQTFMTAERRRQQCALSNRAHAVVERFVRAADLEDHGGHRVRRHVSEEHSIH